MIGLATYTTIGLSVAYMFLHVLDKVNTSEDKDMYSEQLWLSIYEWPAGYLLVMILFWPLFLLAMLLPDGDEK